MPSPTNADVREERADGRKANAGTARRGASKGTASRGGTRGASALSKVAGRATSNRSKLDDILHAATDRFGDVGFDATKWADVAADVGIGATALYHYFESKTHCLFVLVAISINESNQTFSALADRGLPTRETLEEAIRLTFALSPAQVRRSRIIVSEQGRLTGRSGSEREEEARFEARAAMRVMESNWRGLLSKAHAEGVVAVPDAELAMRAVLGLLTSVWHWYRPDGPIPLDRIAESITAATLRMLGATDRS